MSYLIGKLILKDNLIIAKKIPLSTQQSHHWQCVLSEILTPVCYRSLPNGDSNGGVKTAEDPVKTEPEGNVTSISVSEGPQVSKVLLGGEDDKSGEDLEKKEEVTLIQKNEETSLVSSSQLTSSESTTVSVTQSSVTESKESSEKTVVVINTDENKDVLSDSVSSTSTSEISSATVQSSAVARETSTVTQTQETLQEKQSIVESESSLSQSSTVTSKVSEVVSSSASSTMQEFGQSLSSQVPEDDQMKMMMTEHLEGTTVSETSSSVMSVQKSSTSSQSTSKVSMSTVESSGHCEGEPATVVSKVEESCVETSASSASQLHIVDGEVKSSLEEAREEKSVAVRSLESEGGLVRETQAASQETAAVMGEIYIYI